MIREGAPPRTWAPWIAIGAPDVRPALTSASSTDRALVAVLTLMVAGALALRLAFLLGRRRRT